jgi:hypothetical protein
MIVLIKVLIFMLAVMISPSVFADTNGVKIAEVKGEIIVAVWRTGYTYKRIENTDEGEIESTISIGNHWYLLLKDVNGIENDLIEQISLSFIQGEPNDRLSHMVESKKHLFVRITGEKNLNLASGERVLLKECFFRMDELGGGFSCKISKIEK